MLGTILYGLALFSPSIIDQMGFSPVKSQLLSVGPFAAGFFRRCLFLSCFLLQWLYFTLQPRWLTNHVLSSLIVTLLSAYFSDKYQNRSILIILALILCVIGFSMNLRKYTIRSPPSLCTRNQILLTSSCLSESHPYNYICWPNTQAQATNLLRTALFTSPSQAYMLQPLSSLHGWPITLSLISAVQLVSLLDLLLPTPYVVTASWKSENFINSCTFNPVLRRAVFSAHGDFLPKKVLDSQKPQSWIWYCMSMHSLI